MTKFTEVGWVVKGLNTWFPDSTDSGVQTHRFSTKHMRSKNWNNVMFEIVSGESYGSTVDSKNSTTISAIMSDCWRVKEAASRAEPSHSYNQYDLWSLVIGVINWHPTEFLGNYGAKGSNWCQLIMFLHPSPLLVVFRMPLTKAIALSVLTSDFFVVVPACASASHCSLRDVMPMLLGIEICHWIMREECKYHGSSSVRLFPLRGVTRLSNGYAHVLPNTAYTSTTPAFERRHGPPMTLQAI